MVVFRQISSAFADTLQAMQVARQKYVEIVKLSNCKYC